MGKQKGKAGRPTKAEEFRTFELGRDAIIDEFGTEEEFWKFIATESRLSKEHLKLLIEYTYGKAPNEINVSGSLNTFAPPEWFNTLDDEQG